MTINDKSAFVDRFIAKFLENGFGALPKREIEIYIMNLMLEDGQFVDSNGDIDYHEISLLLKLSEVKVKNLIYEVELKYRNNHNFLEQLIALIEKEKYESDKNQIKFSVQSPLLKQYFEYEIRKLPNSISDGSFAKHIVTISRATFEKLLISLYTNDAKIAILIEKLPDKYKEKVIDKDSLFREFSKEFLKTSGKRSANLVFDILNPIDFLRELLND